MHAHAATLVMLVNSGPLVFGDLHSSVSIGGYMNYSSSHEPTAASAFFVSFITLGLAAVVTIAVFAKTSRDGMAWPILLLLYFVINTLYSVLFGLAVSRNGLGWKYVVGSSVALALILGIFGNLRILAEAVHFPVDRFAPAVKLVLSSDASLYLIYAIFLTFAVIHKRSG